MSMEEVIINDHIENVTAKAVLINWILKKIEEIHNEENLEKAYEKAELLNDVLGLSVDYGKIAREVGKTFDRADKVIKGTKKLFIKQVIKAARLFIRELVIR